VALHTSRSDPHTGDVRINFFPRWRVLLPQIAASHEQGLPHRGAGLVHGITACTTLPGRALHSTCRPTTDSSFQLDQHPVRILSRPLVLGVMGPRRVSRGPFAFWASCDGEVGCAAIMYGDASCKDAPRDHVSKCFIWERRGGPGRLGTFRLFGSDTACLPAHEERSAVETFASRKRLSHEGVKSPTWRPPMICKSTTSTLILLLAGTASTPALARARTTRTIIMAGTATAIRLRLSTVRQLRRPHTIRRGLLQHIRAILTARRNRKQR